MNFQLFRSVIGEYKIPSASASFLIFFYTTIDKISNDASSILKYFDDKEAPILVESLEKSAKYLTLFECKIRIKINSNHSIKSKCSFLDIYAVPLPTEDGGVLWNGAIENSDFE